MRTSIVLLLAAGSLVVAFAGSSPAQPDELEKLGALRWKRVLSHDADPSEQRISNVKRAKVPGGWLVHVRSGDTASVTFLPDPTHGWQNGSYRPKAKPKVTVRRAPPKALATPKPEPRYYAGDAKLPVKDQVPGIPWLRRIPGVRYVRTKQLSSAQHQKYQSLQKAQRLGHEFGGELVQGGFQIRWIQKSSFLYQSLGLRVGDVIRSVNGIRIDGALSGDVLHKQLKRRRRFAILISRKGQEWILPFEVTRWLGEDR